MSLDTDTRHDNLDLTEPDELAANQLIDQKIFIAPDADTEEYYQGTEHLQADQNENLTDGEDELDNEQPQMQNENLIVNQEGMAEPEYQTDQVAADQTETRDYQMPKEKDNQMQDNDRQEDYQMQDNDRQEDYQMQDNDGQEMQGYQMPDNDGQEAQDYQMPDNDRQEEQPNDQMEKSEPKKISRKPRGPPKTILANQQKYIETLERQKRMMHSKKTKNNQTKPKKSDIEIPIKTNLSENTGKRRVIIAGKIKYLPINPSYDNSTNDNPIIVKKLQNSNIQTKQSFDKPSSDKLSPVKISLEKELQNSNIQTKQSFDKPSDKLSPVKISLEKEIVEPDNQLTGEKSKTAKSNTTVPKNVTEKRIPSTIAKKAVEHEVAIAKALEKNSKKIPKKTNKKVSQLGTTNKIPSKYAQQIENNVRKQTIKNIKNFSDLRRVRAIQDVNADGNIDANKASITELRKLKLEQRKQNQVDAKKRLEANKKESAIQEILRDENKSKLGKALAIKNLSVNSRHKKPKQPQAENNQN